MASVAHYSRHLAKSKVMRRNPCIHEQAPYNRAMNSSDSPHSKKAPPEFPRLDPAGAAFWDVRFEADFTPWDQGGVPQCLTDYVDRQPAPRRVLIPGCGAAHEVRFFCENKWPVKAIDFSSAAVARARKVLGHLGFSVEQGDFFAPSSAVEKYDVIYERAFLCALPAHLRRAWADRVAALLPSGGHLIGFFFFDVPGRGPPFPIAREELDALLTNRFTLIEDAIPPDSIAVFAGREKWQVWQRC